MAGTALALFAFAGTAQAQVTQDDFQIRTTAELVKLCDVNAADPMNVAATSFCLGFGTGVHQGQQLRQAATRAAPIYCMPTPSPSRTAAMTGFIAWAKATPAVAELTPAAGVLQYLIVTYPCPPARR